MGTQTRSLLRRSRITGRTQYGYACAAYNMGGSSSKAWDNKLPDDLRDKIVVVTGANGGGQAGHQNSPCMDR